MSETIVKNYYTGYVRKEWRRLTSDAYHRLEFETTLHFLKKHFPKQGLILDRRGVIGPSANWCKWRSQARLSRPR